MNEPKSTRRGFLKLLGIGAAASAVPAIIPAPGKGLATPLPAGDVLPTRILPPAGGWMMSGFIGGVGGGFAPEPEDDRCKYCGSAADFDESTNCPNCGGPY